MTAISHRSRGNNPPPTSERMSARRLWLDKSAENDPIQSRAVQSRAHEQGQRAADAPRQVVQSPEGCLTYGSLSVDSCQEAVDQEARIGGDFFDCFSTGDGRLAVVLGDVCGSGAEAAAHVPSVKFALRAFLGEHRSPRVALALLNNLLCGQPPRPLDQARTVALVLLLIDERTGEVEYATAGGEPPLTVRLEGGCEEGGITGILLGVEPGHPYGSVTQRLAPGDLIVMATDGITEAHIGLSQLGYYGMAYLAVIGQATAPLEPCVIAPHVAGSILSGARSFAGGKLHDDACVVVVRRGDG